MSKLDEIRVEFAEFTVSLDPKAKQQIKDLMLELIGPQLLARDDEYHAGYNLAVEEISQRVNEL